MIGDEKDRAAVDAPGERDPDGLAPGGARFDLSQPLLDLVRHRSDILPADLVERRGQRVGLRREETRIDGVRIGTADERDLDHVVGGNHPRVAGVKLTRQAVAVERRMQRVDPIGHVERRALVPLGQEVAHRAIERPREPDGHPLGGHQCERPVDAAHAAGIAIEDAPSGLLDAHVGDTVQSRVDEVDDPADGLEHGRIVSHSVPGRKSRGADRSAPKMRGYSLPTRSGVVVGAGTPPAGSSVTAKATIVVTAPGGAATAVATPVLSGVRRSRSVQVRG